jgi:hypothetical protein
MSRLTTGILGAIALSLISGAAQFALGRDLPEGAQERLRNAFQEPLAGGANPAVNRAAKADRVGGVVLLPAQTRTILLRLDGFSDTSFLLRIPVVARGNGGSSATSSMKPGDRKMAVACEPVVSVLTDVAKQLQPGRCVT